MKITEEQLMNKIYDKVDEQAYYAVETFLQDIIDNPIVKIIKLNDGQNLSGFITGLMLSDSFYEAKDRLADKNQEGLMNSVSTFLGL